MKHEDDVTISKTMTSQNTSLKLLTSYKDKLFAKAEIIHMLISSLYNSLNPVLKRRHITVDFNYKVFHDIDYCSLIN